VHIGASDVDVLGVKPEFMTYSLLLPPGTPADYIARLVKSVSDAAKDLGVSIVGGHTGFYGAVIVPTIGGVTVWGRGKEVITPTGAQVGDVVVITKGAAIEATALLACELRERLLSEGMSKNLVERAANRLKEITVVKDAKIAVTVGGVHAMHDATEGGLARGLWEVAEASRVGLRIERASVLVPADVEAVCSHFALNPMEVISEGTLVLTCDPEQVSALLEAYREEGIEAAVIGRVVEYCDGRVWVNETGLTEPIIPTEVDRFWDVFFGALALLSDNRTEGDRRLCDELKVAVSRLEERNISRLLPEIGANLAYAKKDAKSPDQVAAFPGRILNLKGKTTHVGEPEIGCSRYMASSLLIVREYFPDARCIINLRNSESIRRVCEALGLRVANMPEVPGYRQADEDFARDLHLTLQGMSELPDVITIPDRINLERLILVLGKDLEQIVGTILALSDELAAGARQP
jgi:hydrogenase maturation factor/predicted fused transcriptional regulator/phosphomethylpyrimidine kinase